MWYNMSEDQSQYQEKKFRSSMECLGFTIKTQRLVASLATRTERWVIDDNPFSTDDIIALTQDILTEAKYVGDTATDAEKLKVLKGMHNPYKPR